MTFSRDLARYYLQSRNGVSSPLKPISLSLFINLIKQTGYLMIFGGPARYQDQGMTNSRAKQLDSYYLKRSLTKFFIDDSWFDIVSCVPELPDDMIRTRYQGSPWLLDFMPPSSASATGKVLSERFNKAQIEFDINPRDFIRTLEMFARDIHIQGLSNSLMEYLVKSENSFELLSCWTMLQPRIKEIADGSIPIPVADESNTAYDNGINTLASFKARRKSCSGAVDDITKNLREYVAKIKPYEDRTSKTWKYARLIDLERAFFEVYDFPGDATALPGTAVLKISDHVKRASQSELALSDISHQFQLQVCEFAKQITGEQEEVVFKDVFTRLRQASTDRGQQWDPLYNTIRDLRADIAKKQQAITCLGFRHVLEEMPDKAELVKYFIQPGSGKTASAYWRLAWQFAVERELVLMVYLHRRTISGRSTALSLRTNKLLQELLENDFKEWTKRKTAEELNNAGSKIDNEYKLLKQYNTATTTTSSPTTVLYPSPTPSATPAGTSSPTGPRTRFTSLLSELDLKYDNWNCYQSGLGLYSELSSSIHKYNKQFEVDETNWGRSHFLILKWLAPTVEADGEVIWKNEQKERSLPFTL